MREREREREGEREREREREREASKTHRLSHISHIQICHLFLLLISIRGDGDRG